MSNFLHQGQSGWVGGVGGREVSVTDVTVVTVARKGNIDPAQVTMSAQLRGEVALKERERAWTSQLIGLRKAKR